MANELIVMPEQSVLRDLPRMSALRFRPGDSRQEQEVKRLTIRSLANKFLMLTYFSRGKFSWQATFYRSLEYARLLQDYPQPALTGRFWDGAAAEKLKVEPQQLAAQAGDDEAILMAKREAVFSLFSALYHDQVKGRSPQYREIYAPGQAERAFLPRTLTAAELRVLVEPLLEVLRTHLETCSPALKKALEKYVFQPRLPFDVELAE